MPTGIYGAHRDADHLAEFSRLMQIDIDHQDNPGLTTDDMKAIVCACKGVAYCGLSARGEGVFALIRVPDDAANPDRYKGYYRAFVEQLKAQGVATDDSANTIAKPRYISWDDQPFINEDAEPFASWMPQGSCTQAPRCSNVYATDSDKTFTRAEEIVRQAEQQGNPIATTWQAWRYLAMSLARAFGERGRGLFLRLCDVWSSTTGKHQKQNPDKVFSQANENNPIRNEGYFFTMAKDAGITLK
ncbi:MAG: hypothetical protein MJZ06_04125 [Bacteroidaceae bacterium]|nr:hypothetical protein [Bacteroidaceae bacterium]